MLTQERAVEIRVLARQGLGIKAIARELEVSRNTVRKYLRGEVVGATYQRRKSTRQPKLESFKSYLQKRVEAARPHWIPATVLMREIREQGYPGGISQLKVFLTQFKRREVEAVVRFETPPRQADAGGLYDHSSRSGTVESLRGNPWVQPGKLCALQ
jgi:transposase